MDGTVLEEKSPFNMLGLSFSSKLNRGSYILSITKSTSKKIGALICPVKFFSPEIALYLCWIYGPLPNKASLIFSMGMLIWTCTAGSTSLFSRKVYSLFW